MYFQADFTTTTQLFQVLEDKFILAGWNVISSTLDPFSLNLNSILPNICYVNFLDGNLSGKQTLRLRGDLNGSGSSMSATYHAQYSPGNTNRIYLSIDADSFGLFIYSPSMISIGSSAGAGLYGGFVDRHLAFSADNDAWGIGYIHSLPWAREVAKSAFNATIWQQVNNCPQSSTNTTQDHICPYENIYHLPQQFSRIGTVSYSGYIDAFIQYYQGVLDHNSTYWEYAPLFRIINGGLNDINGQPVIEPMFLIEGASTTGYGDDGTGKNKGLFFRGRIKHCYTGGASLPVGAEVTGRNDTRYISTGNEGWQLLRIQ